MQLGLKRLIVLFLLVLVTSRHALAESRNYPVAGQISHGLQAMTGVNCLTNFFASQFLKLALRLNFGGKIQAKVSSYNLTDLFAGKIRCLEISGSGLHWRGLSLNQVHILTANPFWLKLTGKKRHARLLRPLLIKVDGQLTNDDVGQLFANPKAIPLFRAVKLDLPGIGQQTLQFVQPRVSLSDSKIIIQSQLVTAGSASDKGIELTLTGSPQLVGNSKIVINNMTIESPDIPNPIEFAQFSSQLINPLIDLAKLDRVQRAFRLESLRVLNDRITFSGNLLLAPKQSASSLVEVSNHGK